MLRKLTVLTVLFLAVLVGSYLVIKSIPKPDYSGDDKPLLCTATPEFADYSGEPLYTGDITAVKLDSNTMAQETMLPELSSATNFSVNFAGKYMVISKACGLNCLNYAIVDVVSGAIVHLGLESVTGLDFRVDSRLVIVNPNSRNATRYYELVQSKLRYICEDKLP